MKRISRKIYFLCFSVFVLFLSGCQSVPTFHGPDLYLKSPERPPQEPPAHIQRTADMPLIAAIPGLNVPFAPQGSFQFGKLTELLDAENLPSLIVGYDDTVHPLTQVADLFSDQYSIAITRILPHLNYSVRKENEIRKNQGVPPLKNLDVIGYSQGSVLALDLILRLNRFREEYESLEKAAGKEWEFFREDPELLILIEIIEDYLFIKNIRVQRQERFDKDYDFREFYNRLVERLAKSYDRFRMYLLKPTSVYPQGKVFLGNEPGYPRRYPNIVKWFKENFPANDEKDSISLDFMMKLFDYENLIPLNIRFFSMAGSFFGSPEANKAYGMLSVLPSGLDNLIVGPDVQQIKQTRLGSRHHLKIIKELLKYAEEKGFEKEIHNTYFIVGANGDRGDGLVGQSSAHFSAHLYTHIPVEDFLDDSDKKKLVFEAQRLPVYQVTGLPVHHLPGRKFLFFKRPGVAEMSKKNQVYPFLLAFLKENHKTLQILHEEHNKKLQQFMVELDLPYTDELKGYDFKLRPATSNVKITGRYYNQTSHTVVWTGTFKSKADFFDLKQLEEKGWGEVVLKATKPFGKTIEVELLVDPGTNHFVQITSDKESKRKPFDISVPDVLNWMNKSNFISLMRGEK